MCVLFTIGWEMDVSIFFHRLGYYGTLCVPLQADLRQMFNN